MATSITPTDGFHDFGGGYAARVIERWRDQGFDSVLCHPSRYCSPANSATLTSGLRDGYSVFPIDSEEARSAVAESIASGATYRV